MPDPAPRHPDRPRWRRSGALALAALVCVGALLGWRLGPARPPVVAVEIMAAGPVTRVLAVNGKIAPRERLAIRAAVGEVVLSVAVAAGDVVTAGAVLARLDDRQQAAALRQAEAALAQAVILQAQAAAEFGRDRDLGAQVSRMRLDDARRSLAGAAQEVAGRAALRDQARIALDHYALRAPVAGTVLTRAVDPGQRVDIATTLFTLADLARLRVETDVDETYALQIAPGQRVRLLLLGSAETRMGTVEVVAPRVDPDTGGLAVKIGFDAPVRAPVGLTVTANVVIDSRSALTVPRTALTGEGGAVFVLRAGRAVATPVRVIDWPADRLIVTAGLAPGDRVISDSTGLHDGQILREEGE
ncbi:efflux RND transporter periplasmic adaptor subunit [Rhodobacter capsulatus]|nr:efflux RND transporter periplasmic adaptor subunit [Rhodobacter capsulatus]PZX23192.1 cobalt-zinc-cadmium efflux system membrane fusion protein [Rhodobacter capsulatus]QNR61786.1 efflux RND transporter periplasmic adaptor subunit [Rhodobacter capsulatus]